MRCRGNGDVLTQGISSSLVTVIENKDSRQDIGQICGNMNDAAAVEVWEGGVL